jgi:hypothetical protein
MVLVIIIPFLPSVASVFRERVLFEETLPMQPVFA